MTFLMDSSYKGSVVFLALLKITLMYAYLHIYYYVPMTAIYIKSMCLYMQMWCTVADYVHDANWLYYLH